ncbi:hypothetical protein N9414_10223, partial [Nodularia spumigena CCY9414]
MRLTDNIAVTPGLLVIFNPEHNSDNDTIYVVLYVLLSVSK